MEVQSSNDRRFYAISEVVKQKGNKMSSRVNVGNRLRDVFRSPAALLVSCSAFLLNLSAWAKPIEIPPGLLRHPHHHPVPGVPEVNTWLVLMPIALAIMLWSSLQLFRSRASEKR